MFNRLYKVDHPDGKTLFVRVKLNTEGWSFSLEDEHGDVLAEDYNDWNSWAAGLLPESIPEHKYIDEEMLDRAEMTVEAYHQHLEYDDGELSLAVQRLKYAADHGNSRAKRILVRVWPTTYAHYLSEVE